jgi:hypothetical protein
MRTVLWFPVLALGAQIVSAHEGPGAPPVGHLHAGDALALAVAVIAIGVWLWRRVGR